MTLDRLLEELRGAVAARARAGEERARAIRAALDVYVRAHEALLAAEFAAKNGLEAPDAPDHRGAALALRELVSALPELSSGASPSSGLGSESAAAAAAARSVVRLETMDIPTLEEARRRLATEFDAVRFASMRLDEFMLYAEEFAATARALQERTGGDPLSQRVIRRLTALVHERELPRKVFGLSRAHSGDWQRLANEARERRLSVASSSGHG